MKQLSLACLMHQDSLGHLPAAGWNYRYAGDPTLGFGKDQPGGWHYNILPIIELSALRDLGTGLNAAQRRETGKEVCGTVVKTFICPSRGLGNPIPYTAAAYAFSNINRPAAFARSDYAANAGNRIGGWCNYNTTDHNGVIFSRTGLRLENITDGMSNTYLVGERYLNPDFYENGTSSGNDQGWVVGHDFDAMSPPSLSGINCPMCFTISPFTRFRHRHGNRLPHHPNKSPGSGLILNGDVQIHARLHQVCVPRGAANLGQ